MKFKEFNEWLLETKSITEKDIATVETNDMVSHYNEYNQAYRDFTAKAIQDKVDKKDIEELTLKYNEALVSQLGLVNKALEEQGVVIKRLTQEEIDYSKLSMSDQITKSFNDNLDNLKGLQGGATQAQKHGFSFKLVDMTTIANVTGQVPVEQREAGLNRIAQRRVFIRGLVNNGIASSTLISWVEQTNKQGSPAGTVEGTLKNQISFDMVVVSEKVKKRTAFIKLTDEMINDIPFMMSEVRTELLQDLGLDVDEQILNGDNLGQNLNGIRTQETAFAPGVEWADLVDSANLVDVLVATMDQIEVANFIPSVIVLHPTNVNKLKTLKVSASDDRYVDRILNTAQGLELDGVPIVKNTGMPIGKFLVMDGSKATVFAKEEIDIEVGLDSDDFTKNFRTIRAEWRGLVRIKGNDKPAFVGGDIAAAIAILDPTIV